jgi:prefoldin subunit 5
MTLEKLYEQKGKIITQIEILQTQLKNVNMQISEILHKEQNSGGTDSNRNS